MSGNFLSLDTETCGKDFYHGALPYLVTTCNNLGEQLYWQWDVDPLTRQPKVPSTALQEIQELVEQAELLILHNSKFDVMALAALFKTKKMPFTWDWKKTEDTLIMAHLLGSNSKKSLDVLAVDWVGKKINHYEDRVEVACKQARNLCRSQHPDWRIAKEGLLDMPSMKNQSDKEDRAWKFDTWLLRAIAKEHDYAKPKEGCKHNWDDYNKCVKCGGHSWWVLLQEYANKDSEITYAAWVAMTEEVQRRGLQKLYREQLPLLEVTHRMESRGVTLNKPELRKLRAEYGRESIRLAEVCAGIAASLDYELKLPKTGNNDSLLDFCFGPKDDKKMRYGGGLLNLPIVKLTDTGNPSLDKYAMEEYVVTLQGRQLDFVKALRDKRARDTSLGYIEAYERFMVPWVGSKNDWVGAWSVGVSDDGSGWFILHPWLNISGSDTLRFSSECPNSQNISKKGIVVPCPQCNAVGCDCCDEGYVTSNLRMAFGPAPGREWYSCDMKNVELRIPFYACGEKELIELFEHPDDPPYYGSNHLLNFHTIYPDLWAEVEKEVGFEKAGPTCKKKYADTWYQYCKNGGFAIQYGAQDRPDGEGTADKAFHRPGSHARLKARFKNLEAYNRECVRFAERHGYIETLPDRRIDPTRGYPLLCTRTEYGKIKPTVPLSYKIQGTAMRLTRRAMVKCQQQLDSWRNKDNFDGHITLQVHDELVFDFPRSRVSPLEDLEREKRFGVGTRGRSNLWRARRLQNLMAEGGDYLIPTIPTPCGLEWHDRSWGIGVTL